MWHRGGVGERGCGYFWKLQRLAVRLRWEIRIYWKPKRLAHVKAVHKSAENRRRWAMYIGQFEVRHLPSLDRRPPFVGEMLGPALA